MRTFSFIDKLLVEVDTVVQTIFIPKQRVSLRQSPAAQIDDCNLNQKESQHVAGLMRVNHAGEVCAQALYQGQSLTSRIETVKQQMLQSAIEEVDHLAWCEQRLQELNSKPSILNPYWYVSSFIIGACAGILGDKWSLGFVAETERQVSLHLQKHLQQLPVQDKKSQAILTQMHIDETQHANLAIKSGAANLPWFIQKAMQLMSKVLTSSSYYI
jgi:3-demethoxyubiquinol 3-hydroxylase